MNIIIRKAPSYTGGEVTEMIIGHVPTEVGFCPRLTRCGDLTSMRGLPFLSSFTLNSLQYREDTTYCL